MATPRVGIKKALSSADAMIYRLELISARLQDPKPALAKVAEEFALMEKQRFMNRGRAPEFGINQEWKALQPYTIQRRAREGGNPMDQPLLNRGFLARAASTPSVNYFGTKSLSIYIDVSKADAKYNPKHKNYGVYHQNGDGRGGMGNPPPKREFVTITPTFVEIAAKILQFYVMEGKGSKAQEKNLKIPSNSSVKSKTEVQARSHELRVQRNTKAAEKRSGSMATNIKNEKNKINQQQKEIAIAKQAPKTIVTKTIENTRSYGAKGFSSFAEQRAYNESRGRG